MNSAMLASFVDPCQITRLHALHSAVPPHVGRGTLHVAMALHTCKAIPLSFQPASTAASTTRRHRQHGAALSVGGSTCAPTERGGSHRGDRPCPRGGCTRQ